MNARWTALCVLLGLATAPGLAPAQTGATPHRTGGAMLSYGPDYADVYREAAQYVAKILRGTAPGELAMAQPSRFELVLNLKLARSLGINIPQSMLLRADEVIQ